MANRKQTKLAMRRAIVPDVRQFVMLTFQGAPVYCSLTHREVSPKDCNVDHQDPNTFSALIHAYADEFGWPDCHLCEETGYWKITDEAVERHFRAYHNSTAQLRIVSYEAHKQLNRENTK